MNELFAFTRALLFFSPVFIYSIIFNNAIQKKYLGHYPRLYFSTKECSMQSPQCISPDKKIIGGILRMQKEKKIVENNYEIFRWVYVKLGMQISPLPRTTRKMLTIGECHPMYACLPLVWPPAFLCLTKPWGKKIAFFVVYQINEAVYAWFLSWKGDRGIYGTIWYKGVWNFTRKMPVLADWRLQPVYIGCGFCLESATGFVETLEIGRW